MAAREGETIVWLNNKLGSTDDLWSGVSISSQLMKDRLLSIVQCFHSLQAHVKVKLLLAFLHVPKRNRDEWKEDLNLLYKIACEDGDLWVSMVAEIIRTFPLTGNLNMDVKDEHRSYHEMLGDIKKLVRFQQGVNMLPLESSYLNKTSLNSISVVLPTPAKHFAIKRKPKSAALRVEILQKSTDAANNLKKNVSTFPVKMRSFAKKMDDDTPLKGLPNNTLSGSSLRSNSVLGRFSGSMTQKRDPNNQKEGGIKLLDFDALPLSAKESRKRRKLELEQQKAQKKEESHAAAAAASANTTAVSAAAAMPDYAAGLLAVASFESLKSPQHSNEQSSVSSATTATVPTTTTIPLLSPNLVISSPNTLPTQIRFTVVPVNTSIASTPQQQQQQQFTPIIITQQNRPPQMILTAQRLNQPSTILIQPSISTTSSPLIIRAPQDCTSPVRNLVPTRIKVLQPPQTLGNTQQQQKQQQQLSVVTATTATTTTPVATAIVAATAGGGAESQPKKELFLTRDQMLEAQDMFNTYPNITRPEKALILGFMAGARENPCPNQGPVLNIRLGETLESLPQPEGTFQPMVVETYLQLNYSTGEFKKLRKTRGREGDGE